MEFKVTGQLTGFAKSKNKRHFFFEFQAYLLSGFSVFGFFMRK